MDQAGPVPWEQYGDGGVVHMLHAQIITPAVRQGDDRQLLKSALQWAIKFGREGAAVTPDYSSGLAAYDRWISAVKTIKRPIEGVGPMYNAWTWRECREQALAFLTMARDGEDNQRLDPVYDEAIRHYETVVRKLGRVCEQFPCATAAPGTEEQRITEAVSALKLAEEQGLRALEAIVEQL